ncbi:TPA: XRE family transcriptional regulator [Enterococcus faecalis]|nr:XRE family transcriptional regulator [Enterococcus faecalis]HBI1786728.1 XRE family transcriptional regulator [Enterococcus faecalis]HBI1792102.1 XRE family transcriptional regulator [Enterococcus faecalis]HBI1888019.1 XRE family transcriptional regulator [Enterococcus faecalis]HBI1898845.1 XRE family transcriptional regulator [Enterococcus faecalis]
MFFGEKLQSLRELNGLSRKEFADKIGVTEQAVWQYENQYTVPKFEVVNEIKKIFSVRSQFFYTKPFLKQVSKIEGIAYRAEDRDSRKKAKMETAFVDFSSYFLDKFEERLIPPLNTISALREEVIKLYNKNSDLESGSFDLEKIAEYARKKLDIRENKELLYKLEMSGVYILEKNMGTSIDAYSTWTENEKPFIVLGNKKKSAVRRNFDLAHELGHLLLHYKIDMDSLSKDEHKKIEKEANDFASFFLLPKDQFLEDFSMISKKSNPKSYLDLKSKYMVSIGALEYRAYKLGLLTFEENRYFYASLNRYGYRKEEPLDEDIAIVRPGKIRALLDMVFKNKMFVLSDILDEYKIDRDFLESLFCLERDFLSKYDNEIEREYYSNNKIVSLFPNLG